MAQKVDISETVKILWFGDSCVFNFHFSVLIQIIRLSAESHCRHL